MKFGIVTLPRRAVVAIPEDLPADEANAAGARALPNITRWWLS